MQIASVTIGQQRPAESTQDLGSRGAAEGDAGAPPPAMASTRLHKRLSYDAEISFHCEGREVHQARTGNISGGGLFVRTDQLCAPGAIITVLVPLPTPDEAFWATAEVRWNRATEHPFGPAGMGVEFIAVDSRSRAVLREFLRRASAA